jgi:hypothetical protein
MVLHVVSDKFVAQLHRQSFFGLCTSKSESCWINLSYCWQAIIWLQLLLCSYQLTVDWCNLISCSGAVVLHVCWYVTMIDTSQWWWQSWSSWFSKWQWRLDAFDCITALIVALGVMLCFCSCVTRATQISISTNFVLKVVRTFRRQVYGERDVAAAFLPHQGQPLASRLIIVTTLVRNVTFILWSFGHSHEYCCFLQLAVWKTQLPGRMMLSTLHFADARCRLLVLYPHDLQNVRLAGSTSWWKDSYPRPSPISNRILQNAIPAKAHSVVQ